jgi:hypothetical protein
VIHHNRSFISSHRLSSDLDLLLSNAAAAVPPATGARTTNPKSHISTHSGLAFAPSLKQSVSSSTLVLLEFTVLL